MEESVIEPQVKRQGRKLRDGGWANTSYWDEFALGLTRLSATFA